MGKFTLMNKARSKIKVIETFENSNNLSCIINEIFKSYGCVYKQSVKKDMKDNKVKSKGKNL